LMQVRFVSTAPHPIRTFEISATQNGLFTL